MGKIHIKNHNDPTKKQKIREHKKKFATEVEIIKPKAITDIHSYARSKNKWFRLSILINILQFGLILCLIQSMRS